MGWNKREPENLIGKKFGFLTVLERAESNTRRIKWRCICDCGTEKIVSGENLRSGHTKSCGCYQKKRLRETKGVSELVANMSCSPIYKVWSAMKQRCNNPKNAYYCNYGGRGITVCESWNTSFENFYRDMAEGYKKGLELDRIDNNKGYSPDNCRWVTRKVNQRNKRNSRIIDGHNLAEFCEKTGQSENRVISRITKNGWNEKEALYTPKQRGRYGVHITTQPLSI